MGALAEIEETYPSIKILCSEAELPYVTGKEKSLRVLQAEAELLDNSLNGLERTEMLRIKEYLLSIRPALQASALHSGEVLPYCGIEVHDTNARAYLSLC